MSRKYQRGAKGIFYASPLLFAAACALLTVIIGVFAVNNVQREKQLMTAALSQEGTAILNLVSATTRAMLRRAVMHGETGEEAWRQATQQAIADGSHHPRITALFLVDTQGTIIAHSRQERVGERLAEETREFLETVLRFEAKQPFRVVEETDDRRYFQIAASFPLMADRQRPPQMRELSRERQGRRQGRPIPPGLEPLLAGIDGQNYFLVAELELEDFHQAVRKQMIQVIILSLVLLLVGIAGILSLMMLQGLRGSQVRLSRMREFTEVLVSSLPIGLIATGPDGLIRTCNQSACSMLNLDQKRALDQPFTAVLPERLRELFAVPAHDRSRKRWEVTLPEQDGAEKSLHVTRMVLDDPSRLHTGTMLLIQDLSQLKELEGELERAERDAAIGRMAAGVAHEIRNPLSSIKGLALLLSGRLQQDAIARESLNLLVTEVERLNRSIGELLDYSRPAQLNLETVEVDSVIADGVSLLRSDALAAGIEITEQYRCAGCTVAGDRDKLIQVVLNLGLNAIQAMEQGGRLCVSSEVDDRSVNISIGDSGPGIAPAILEKVFDPYFTTKQDGTGLGLAMSKKIVEDHRGTLTLLSPEGAGTIAVVRLPVY